MFETEHLKERNSLEINVGLDFKTMKVQVAYDRLIATIRVKKVHPILNDGQWHVYPWLIGFPVDPA